MSRTLVILDLHFCLVRNLVVWIRVRHLVDLIGSWINTLELSIMFLITFCTAFLVNTSS